MIRSFLDGRVPAVVRATETSAAPVPAAWRLSYTETQELPIVTPGPGTSGVQGIEMRLLSGDPANPGPYTISIRVPPNTHIGAHTHRDSRSAVVVAGVWYIGFGDSPDDTQARALEAGSYYLEPAGVEHFAYTGADGATVYITGTGPSDTRHVAGPPR
jgi:quercetin dioxygenase-like cupin family protein